MILAREPLSVLWFGRADRPWSQAALRKLLAVAQVRLVSDQRRSIPQAATLPETVDWLVWEEGYPGEVSDEQLQELLRQYPLAGVAVLQGPWSAAKYAPGKARLFPAIEVAWHSWASFLRRLAERKRPVCSDEQALLPLPATFPRREENAHRGRSGNGPFPHSAGLQRMNGSGERWILVRDVELRRWLVEELSQQGVPVRWFPVPAAPGELVALGRTGGPDVVFWELGAWFPQAPQRELRHLALGLRPRRLVGLGVQGWPDLAWLPPELPATETVLLPLPVPPAALTGFNTTGNSESARAA